MQLHSTEVKTAKQLHKVSGI